MCYLTTVFLIFLISLNAYAEIPPALTDSKTDEPVYILTSLPSIKRNTAVSELKRIRSNTPEAEILEIVKETEVFRLKVECFDNRASAVKLQKTLSKKCSTSFMVHEEGAFCVIAGSQMDYNSALVARKLYAKKNITTSIVKISLPLKQWQIFIGYYYDLKDAVYRADTLAKKGVITTINTLDDAPAIRSKNTLNRLISEETAKSIK